VVKIAVPSRKIDIDEYRDFASYKSISLKHRRAIMRADTRIRYNCIVYVIQLLLIALVVEIEIGII